MTTQRYVIEARGQQLRIVGPECVTRWYGPDRRIAVHHACERANEIGSLVILKQLSDLGALRPGIR